MDQHVFHRIFLDDSVGQSLHENRVNAAKHHVPGCVVTSVFHRLGKANNPSFVQVPDIHLMNLRVIQNDLLQCTVVYVPGPRRIPFLHKPDVTGKEQFRFPFGFLGLDDRKDCYLQICSILRLIPWPIQNQLHGTVYFVLKTEYTGIQIIRVRMRYDACSIPLVSP